MNQNHVWKISLFHGHEISWFDDNLFIDTYIRGFQIKHNNTKVKK